MTGDLLQSRWHKRIIPLFWRTRPYTWTLGILICLRSVAVAVSLVLLPADRVGSADKLLKLQSFNEWAAEFLVVGVVGLVVLLLRRRCELAPYVLLTGAALNALWAVFDIWGATTTDHGIGTLGAVHSVTFAAMNWTFALLMFRRQRPDLVE